MSAIDMTLADFVRLLDDRLNGVTRYSPLYIIGHNPLPGTGVQLLCAMSNGNVLRVALLNEADKLLVYDKMTRVSLNQAIALRASLAAMLDVKEIQVQVVDVKVMAGVVMNDNWLPVPRLVCIRSDMGWEGTDTEIMERLLGASGLDVKLVGKPATLQLNLYGTYPASADDPSGV